MKRIFKVFAVAALLVAAPVETDAQFFKKLGKAIDKVSKSVDKVLDTAAGYTYTETPDGAKLSSKLVSFSVEYQGVTWRDDHCAVDFLVTNNGYESKRVYSFDKVKAISSNGMTCSVRSVVGGSMTSLGNGDFDFEPGVPLRVTVAIYDLPESGANISLLQLRTRTDGEKDYEDRYIELRGLTIPAKPSAASAATGPFKGEWSFGNDINGGSLFLDLYGKSIEGVSVDKCYGMINIYVNSGSRMDECDIIGCSTNGNTATIKFIGGRDGNTYQCVLTYNTSNKQIKVSNLKLVAYADGESEGRSECYLQDGQVFVK